MRKELKYNPLDLQGLEISNAVVNTFPTKIDAENYFALKSFGAEQKGMQVIFLDTLKTAKWDGTQFIEGNSNTAIETFENFSALPDPTTTPNTFYWVLNAQGTSWLPGFLGGNYYNKGLYYSDGTSWTFSEVPFQAIQIEVDAGTDNTKFVTPLTLKDSVQWSTKVDKVIGKQLSTEDYTTAEKNKLDGIEPLAEVNNISDTNATDLTDGGDTSLHIHDSRYYTETETDNLLNEKFDTPTGDNTQYLDGAGTPTTFPTIPSGFGDLAYLNEVDTDEIVNHAVTNTKLAQMSANTVKGRLSGNGTPQDVDMVNLPISTATQTALNLKQDNLGFTPANKAGDTFTGDISASNLSGTNTGDETTVSIQTKRPIKTINGNSVEGSGNISISVNIPILTENPITPQQGEQWLIQEIIQTGQAIGTLGTTYTTPIETENYTLNIQTNTVIKTINL